MKTNQPPEEKKEFYIKSNSSWTLYNPHHIGKTFVEAFSNEIQNLPDTTVNKRENNLTKKEKKALEDFQKTRRYSHYQSRQRRCSSHPRLIGLHKRSQQTTRRRKFLKKMQQRPDIHHNKQVNELIESFRRKEPLSNEKNG